MIYEILNVISRTHNLETVKLTVLTKMKSTFFYFDINLKRLPIYIYVTHK